MLRVLVADGTDGFRTALKEELGQNYAVQTCADGASALDMVRSFAPDFLLVDLTLPGMDGLSLIQSITESGNKPGILAMTRFLSDYVLEAGSRLGIDYMMVKPCSVRSVVSRLEDLAASRSRTEMKRSDFCSSVSNLLLVMGIPTNRKGYHYLQEAIPIYSSDPEQSITKELYPAVGKICNAAPVQVERAIRGAIEKAWTNRNDQIWKLYFSPQSNGHIPKPTNSEFISRLADYMNLNLGVIT